MTPIPDLEQAIWVGVERHLDEQITIPEAVAAWLDEYPFPLADADRPEVEAGICEFIRVSLK